MSGALFKTVIVVHFLMAPAGSQTWMDKSALTPNEEPIETSPLTLQSSGTVFQLFNTLLDFWHAERFCRAQFSALPTRGRSVEADGALQLLRQAGLVTPVWVSDPGGATDTQFPLPKQYLHPPALTFPLEAQEAFARLDVSFPPLQAVSVCARVQWDRRHNQLATLFSYATSDFTNELLLRGQPDSTGRVLLAVIVQGQHGPFRASFPNDATWHHLCVSWRVSDGYWAVHVDGDLRDSGTRASGEANRDIHGDGIFIVGQDQDSFGGNFTEPFVGNVTELSLWNVALEDWQVLALSSCSPLEVAPLFEWSPARMTLHSEVKQMMASVCCPAGCRAPNCGALDPGASVGASPQYTTAPCTQKQSVVCLLSQERFLKIKELKEDPADNPSSFMLHLRQITNGTLARKGLLPDQGQPLNWSQASAILTMSQEALVQTAEELQPSDMLALVQLLALTSNVGTPANSSQQDAALLSHQFLAVADRMVSPENMEQWRAVSQVVNGPMSVVHSIDNLVINLSPLLTADRDRIVIDGENIRLNVQHMSPELHSSSPGFCGPAAEAQSKLDCIEVPAQNMQALQSRGIERLTLLNTWYGSLPPLVGSESNISLLPAVSDGSQKYKGAVLGSAVISSMVIGEGQPVSTAVRFHLQHRVQGNQELVYDPICAFWDFNLAPESGGSWSTKGCEVTSTWLDSTSCYCNHTTNFALLLQIYEVQRSSESQNALQVLTFIGCGVSLCGLTLTFILFIAVGVPKSDRTTVHKNLIVALAAAELLLMCSDAASSHREACLAMTALLHLFFMASFTWMLVEGLLLWSKVVSVNISEDRRMKLYYVIGWGLPILLVGLTLAVSFHKYQAEGYCWLNVQTRVIWAFVGPVLFVLAVNTVVLWRVVMVTVSSARRRAKMLSPSGSSQLHALDLTWAATRPVLILLPVLGVTWLCGVLVHLSIVLAYLFVALNAFQGLYIFLVYAVYNSEVRAAISRIKEKRKPLSFTNCSQPISFLPSHRPTKTSWTRPSSPETSDTSGPGSANSKSLVIQNESFKRESIVNFSLKSAAADQVVQLTAFKPSGC